MSTYIDNRDSGEMSRYMEARIEALRRRLAEKDLEIQRLQAELTASMNALRLLEIKESK